MRIAARIAVFVLALALAGAFVFRGELTRLNSVLTLFDEDRIVGNFVAMDDLFEAVTLSRGDGPVTPLPEGAAIAPPEGLDDWMAARTVTSLLVLKDGRIAYETYRLGTDEADHRIAWSVAKSWLSILTGILVEEGALSLDDQVVDHAPSLQGSAYDGATLRDVLQMESGVAFDEDYLDFWSDINRMGRALALGGSLDGFTTGLQDRVRAPGEEWTYVSMDTHVVGMVLRGATGRTIPDLMEQKVIAPLGLEDDVVYLTDSRDTAFVLGGLNMRTRDYARFGLMVLQDGVIGDRRVVSAEWLKEATTASAKTADGRMDYGYQWWLAADARPGEVLARGVYGQYIYIDRVSGTVIVSTAADRRFREPGVNETNIDMFRRLAAAPQQ